MDVHNRRKGDDNVNAYAVKSEMPFVARDVLKRTPASEENRNMIEYMDSHEFSFRFDKNTGEFVRGVNKK